jgi:2-polyprenyl-6-methoxyphenol hydroxylase-like FAD-dependent oxidoreductase
MVQFAASHGRTPDRGPADEEERMKVLIAGGGIGGLVLALGLHRAGIAAEIYESVEALRPRGVGINLLPHAVKELTALGLLDDLRRTGIETAELLYFNKYGKRIWREDRGLAAGYRWPQFSIHRGRLHMLLLATVEARLGKGALRTGHHLAEFTERGDRVEATFVDRATGEVAARAAGDVLIGADGIHSVVRKSFYPREGVPRFSGRLLWRAVTETVPFLTGRSMIMAGHQDRKFVAYPICPETAARGRSLVNWIAEMTVGGEEPATRDWDRLADRNLFAAAYASWQWDWLDVPALIAGAGEIYEYPLVDRDPLPRWSIGRVTLLGDAAHPMYPIGSNGASQAILDARALTEALAAAAGDGVAALQRYEAARLGPTSAIVLANRQNGPEQVMQIVEERAPNGFTDLDAVIAPSELAEIAGRYKQIAGFDRDRLNQGAAPPAR